MLNKFTSAEISYFIMLYRKHPTDIDLVFEKFRIWGAIKYKFNTYKKPKFLDKVLKLEEYYKTVT